MSLSLVQRFGLWKFLDTQLASVRKSGLLQSAADDLVPGERVAIKFGGRLAGWLSMPKPMQRSAYVADNARFLAWAKVQYPEKIEYVPQVKVDAALLEYLTEHRPESLSVIERVDGQWADDIRAALTDQGYYITAKGEKLTEVPGIEIPEPVPSVPRVSLEHDAAEIIAAAWPQIQGSLREVLALPAPPEASDAA
jgi:hypothetical protein